MRDVVQAVEPDLLADQVASPVDPLPRRCHEHRRGHFRLVHRAACDGLDRRVSRLQDRERADRNPRELRFAREHGRNGQRPVPDHGDLGIDSLLREEAPMLCVHHLRGRIRRDDRDLDLSQLETVSRLRGRRAGQWNCKECDREKQRHPSQRTPYETRRRAHGHSLSMDASILRFCSAEITSWIAFRTSRNRGELRVAVCVLGRGSPTSTELATLPGPGLRTRTRSAR